MGTGTSKDRDEVNKREVLNKFIFSRTKKCALSFFFHRLISNFLYPIPSIVGTLAESLKRAGTQYREQVESIFRVFGVLFACISRSSASGCASRKLQNDYKDFGKRVTSGT